MKYIYYYETCIGRVGIAEENNKITNVVINENLLNVEIKETDTINYAYKQLVEYLNGQRKVFDLEYHIESTEFRKSVLNELINIPYGTTCSYKDIAIKISNPKSYRAVGSANHANPVPIFIPCHRVIANNGSIGGYGLGLEMKSYLLKLEDKYK